MELHRTAVLAQAKVRGDELVERHLLVTSRALAEQLIAQAKAEREVIARHEAERQYQINKAIGALCHELGI